MTHTATIAIALLLAGCATVTGVVSTGADTYMVASHGVMGHSSAGEQKTLAFQQADSYCKGLGKQLQAIDVKESPGGFGRIASASVDFRCVTASK